MIHAASPPKPVRLTQLLYSMTVLRAILIGAALCVYLRDPDDVVWRVIKLSPHARALEHLCFGVAAAVLCASLALAVRALGNAGRAGDNAPALNLLQNLLRAIGIGSLTPLGGFVLLVTGELALSLFVVRHTASAAAMAGTGPGWRASMKADPGMWCACASMIIFSVVLVDRVADLLFGLSALVGVGAAIRTRMSA